MASGRLFRVARAAWMLLLRARLAFVRGRVRYDWVRDRHELVKPLGRHLYVVATWKGKPPGRRRGRT